MTKLMLVVSTQRSGSTLLKSDIESMGGMGKPWELLMTLVRQDKRVFKKGGQNATKSVGLEDVKAQIADKGRGKDGTPDVYGLKLMVSYADHINWMLGGEKDVEPVQATQNVIDWAYDTYDEVCLLSIVRPSMLDQSISRAMAKSTGLYHVKKDDPTQQQVEVDPDELNLAILREIPIVIRHNRNLRTVIDNNAERILNVNFNDLVRDQEATNRAIAAHARKAGFTPGQDVADRTQEKVIKKEKALQIKDTFFRFLLNEGLGPDTFPALRAILDETA